MKILLDIFELYTKNSHPKFVKSYKMVCPNQLNTIAKYMSSGNKAKQRLGFSKYQN